MKNIFIHYKCIPSLLISFLTELPLFCHAWLLSRIHLFMKGELCGHQVKTILNFSIHISFQDNYNNCIPYNNIWEFGAMCSHVCEILYSEYIFQPFFTIFTGENYITCLLLIIIIFNCFHTYCRFPHVSISHSEYTQPFASSQCKFQTQNFNFPWPHLFINCPHMQTDRQREGLSISRCGNVHSIK